MRPVDLRVFRAKHKLTQEDLADIIGTSQSYVSQVENNTRRLDKDQLRLIISSVKDKSVKDKKVILRKKKS